MPRISLSQLSGVKKYLHRRTLIVLLILAALVAGWGAFTRGTQSDRATGASATRTVQVKSIAELSSEAAPLFVVGSVTSRSEATVRAESSGQVTGVYRALGDSVGAGAVIAELDNASQRAAVLQAKGSVDAAEAALAKVLSGTRSEQIAILQSSLEGAKNGAVSALLSTYASIDNAIVSGTDAMFTDPDGNVPHFNVTVAAYQLFIDIENGRLAIGPSILRQQFVARSLTASSDLIVEIGRTEKEVRDIRTFLDNVVAGLNNAVPSSSVSQSAIDAYKATTVAARSSANASLSSLASARQALQTAEKNLEQGMSGPVREDVAAAEASVTQAKGVYAAALANLEKTIIRAPIPGTINSFSLKRGDYVSQATPVVTIANNGALEVVAYVTEQDIIDIKVGSEATLDNGIRGTVTRIAPALDPLTKKIEVKIGVSGKSDALVNGQSVTVAFERTVLTQALDISRLTIPISAIKVGADETVVFTLSDEGTLVAHTVTLGELLGDRVVIREGLTLDMRIVTDARGLRAGQTVEMR